MSYHSRSSSTFQPSSDVKYGRPHCPKVESSSSSTYTSGSPLWNPRLQSILSCVPAKRAVTSTFGRHTGAAQVDCRIMTSVLQLRHLSLSSPQYSCFFRLNRRRVSLLQPVTRITCIGQRCRIREALPFRQAPMKYPPCVD